MGKRLAFVFLIFSVFGCDVFRYDLGGEGQMCFDNHTCRPGFACGDDGICYRKCNGNSDCAQDGLYCNGEEYCDERGLCAHQGNPCG